MGPPADFDWSDEKAASNEVKHGVPFDYATRVFLDDGYVDFDASRGPDGEERRKAIGEIEGRLYCVVYTPRGDVCRIISARRANAKERKAYG
jgi:uncharacterized DUF497 family protein